MVTVMITVPTLMDVRLLIAKAGISPTAACRLAKLHHAVYHRWDRAALDNKSGPGIENVRALVKAVQDIIDQNEAARNRRRP